MGAKLTLIASFALAALMPRVAAANDALDQLRQQAGVTPEIPAVSAPAKLDFAVLEAKLEQACYDALQRYYYPDKNLVNFMNQLTKEFIDPLSHRCDLTQPLFNFHQMDAGVYRSAKPTPEGMDQLKAMGVKTILDLSSDYPWQGTTEAQLTGGKGLGFENVPIDYTKWPTYQELDRALAIATDPAKQPVLFHCTCGYDRTGIVAAAYRVVVQGWPAAQATQEAKALGWHFPACGDLTQFLTAYAQYRTSVAAKPAP